MELFINYWERVIYHMAYIGETFSKGELETNVLVILTVINLIALVILLAYMMNNRYTKCGTLPFWLVSCLFFGGIGGAMFILTEIVIRKNKRSGNIVFWGQTLFPTIVALGVFFVLINMNKYAKLNISDEKAMSLCLLIGVFVVICQIIRSVFKKSNRSIYILHNNDYCKVELAKYAEIKANRKIIANQYKKLSREEVRECFLEEEKDTGLYVEKIFRRYNEEKKEEKINVLELVPLVDRCLWANVAALMLLYMATTPYLVWFLITIENMFL